MKKVLIITLALFTANIMTACGSRLNTELADMSQIAQPNQMVAATSVWSIKKEIEKDAANTFNEMDKNGDKMISPEEYEVKTPEQAQAFYALDDNHDGKVTLKEMVPNFFTKVGMAIRLQRTASSLFNILDRSKDKYLSIEELDTTLISADFKNEFSKYDVEKKWLFFNRGTSGKLSKTEFQNLFASVAIKSLNAQVSAPTQPVTPVPAQ
jgi:Ca2+-binding EF-hand superfamily protein